MWIRPHQRERVQNPKRKEDADKELNGQVLKSRGKSWEQKKPGGEREGAMYL